MLRIGLECKKSTTQKLFSLLRGNVQPCFKVWMYGKSVYAIFRINSFSALNDLIEKLDGCGLKFKVFRIEEVSR